MTQYLIKALTNIPPLTISTPGIKKLLSNINPHKATGPDNISGRVLKELQEKTAPILSLIFTKYFHTGQTPIDWKTANVNIMLLLPLKRKTNTKPSTIGPYILNLHLLQVNGAYSNQTRYEPPRKQQNPL